MSDTKNAVAVKGENGCEGTSFTWPFFTAPFPMDLDSSVLHLGRTVSLSPLSTF